MRLGISPIGWSNDDLPELGGDTPLETCLAEARRAPLEGVAQSVALLRRVMPSAA
jgi:inosose dehydratase/3D-(3,5/4)-trihydroxycyclohexane-1,2-dione acylhydrolase (decyclizing)